MLSRVEVFIVGAILVGTILIKNSFAYMHGLFRGWRVKCNRNC